MTADANGFCDILLIWSATDSQHDGGYVRFVFTEKSLANNGQKVLDIKLK